jgi:hypothetical protein
MAQSAYGSRMGVGDICGIPAGEDQPDLTYVHLWATSHLECTEPMKCHGESLIESCCQLCYQQGFSIQAACDARTGMCNTILLLCHQDAYRAPHATGFKRTPMDTSYDAAVEEWELVAFDVVAALLKKLNLSPTDVSADNYIMRMCLLRLVW